MRNNIRVCDVVEKRVLTLEGDFVAFCKVLFPLVKQSVLEDTHPQGYSLNPNSLPRKRAKRRLDCE
jgi:hypothetical protein